MRVDDLRALSNGTPKAMRDDIAHYLRSCPIFLAWMEYTTDVIDDRFGVSGRKCGHVRWHVLLAA